MNNTRKVSCPFGLLNIGGLVDTKPIMSIDDIIGAEVTIPLFCHESYKIKPTFNVSLDSSFGIISIKNDNNDGKYYQKKFRRMVLWDFGDGHTEEGYSVEHSYKKPGRYKISCTFYDINRCAWKNSYHIYVSVKEIIPTKLSFVKNLVKSEIKCSKIERIAQLEAFLSSSCNDNLKVQAQRIFTEQEVQSSFDEIGKNYKEIENDIFKFSRKYWTFLENEQQLLFQSDKIYGDRLTPQDLYSPSYIDLYGKFYYDPSDSDKPINIKIYQVIPYINIDDNLKTIRILNPNCFIDDIISSQDDEETFNEKFTKVVPITQVYTHEQLPSDVTFIGKRGFVDIFYKNDFITDVNHLNTFSFHYDIEHTNITDELKTSDNYLNINPIGLSLRVVNNDFDKIKIGVSLDGFIRELSEENDLNEKNYYIDPYLIHSLMKGIELDFYVFPYILYHTDQEIIDGTELVIGDEDEADFISVNKMYYVPKDCEIQKITPIANISRFNGIASIWDNDRNIEQIEPWLKRLSFILYDYIDYTISVNLGGKTFDVEIVKDSLIKPDELQVPTEQTVKENINELIQTYMCHPMFEEAQNIKDFFTTVLKSKNLINYSLTKSNNFIDDYSNVKTCYLSQLISTLKMMGEDILEYEKGGFEGVNELRDFVRLLTMNHSDLVGHVIGEDLDTTIRLDKKGKNVSDQLKITDLLSIQLSNTNHNRGKIKSINRDGKQYDCKSIHKDGLDIIVQDKYTFETKIVNLRLVKDEELTDGYITINDYKPSWGWNLLLPQRYNDCLYKLNENDMYKMNNNGTSLYSKKDIERIRQTMAQILDGYYSFYLLNPNVNNERVGNFLDESTITTRIDDPMDWKNTWGITHELLMKILMESGNYKHSKTVIEDNIQSRYLMRKLMSSDSIYGVIDEEISNINCSVYIDDMLDYDTYVSSLIKVYGVICEGTEQYLELTLENSSVKDKDGEHMIQTEEPQMLFKIKIDEDGVIHPTKQIYNIVSGRFTGTLTVSLCGKIKKEKGEIKGFLWDVSLDLFTIK